MSGDRRRGRDGAVAFLPLTLAANFCLATAGSERASVRVSQSVRHRRQSTEQADCPPTHYTCAARATNTSPPPGPGPLVVPDIKMPLPASLLPLSPEALRNGTTSAIRGHTTPTLLPSLARIYACMRRY
ncbi:hypothetical protein BDA96_04G235300 [Sorghum bicolor]|uniref:Secreted protein n=1 Tax=Sorghum bicolor TaxID=4558 RepID=A0A921UJ13_SORBI|nr:hypothetical protein BDA96_04G235300 [Sorghum bicolor]